jgi:hypothetical protein
MDYLRLGTLDLLKLLGGLIVRRLQYGGSSHFVIEQSDGTQALLPAWMTAPWAAQLAIIERPRLLLEALHVLRITIIGALLSTPIHSYPCACDFDEEE